MDSFLPRTTCFLLAALAMNFCDSPSVARASDDTPASSAIAIDWLSARGLDQEASGKSENLTLGGPTGGKVLLEPNLPQIAQLLIKTDDLLSAQPQIDFEKFEPPLPPGVGGKINIYAVPLGDANPAHGALLATMALQDIPATQPTLLPDVSAKIKEWLEAKGTGFNLLLVLDGTTAKITLGSATDPRGKPELFLKIKSYPAAHLFTVPFGPEPGVYTRVVDGHLNYGGKRLRLWGVVGHPNVDRIARMGFNAERVWGPGAAVGDDKLYSAESAKRGEFQPSTKGDGSQLDLADQHLSELKAHGMFVMLAALTQTIPLEPLCQEGSMVSGGDDWAQWKEAVQAKGASGPAYYLFVDERLQKARSQHAKNLLTHVNPYTGKAYGEEEAIAIYEIFNENGFVFKMLNGEFDKWPPYFKAKLQKLWNDWLAAKYKNDAALVQAWGKQNAGESLERGSVQPAPDFENRLKYPEARANDYVHFMSDLENDFNQKFRSYCQSLFPVGIGVNGVPFSFDTMFRPNIPWAYTSCLGDVFSYGMYYWDLKSSLEKPPGSYLIDSFTVEKKPTVLYETNIGRPNPYRAEYPIKLAALASYQDWDGIFWHYWAQVDGDVELPYLTQKILPPMPTFYWAAVEHQTDPVMGTSMALASRIFLGHYLPPAEAPKIFTLGKNSLFSYSAFRGVNVSAATFTSGSALQFVPWNDALPASGLVPVAERLQHAIASGHYITWDWPNGRLIIDAPNVKAYVGKTDGFFRFSDGITLGNVSTPWVAFVLESADGKPLLGAVAPSKMLIGAVADARNTGFDFNYSAIGGPTEQAKAVHAVGHAPVIVDQVEYSVWFPRQFSGTLRAYDFALREKQSTPIEKNNVFAQKGGTPFLNELEISWWGAPGSLPIATATKIETANPSATSSPQAANSSTILKAADLLNPIPGLDWNMDYLAAHRYVENSPLAFTTFSATDASPATDKSITISDLQLGAFWNNAVDARVGFQSDRMSEVEITLKTPPPAEEVIARFSPFLGPPAESKIDVQYGATRVFWKGRGASSAITMTESQGIMKILFSRPTTEH